MTTETIPTTTLPLPVRIHSLRRWAEIPDRVEHDADACEGPITMQHAIDDIVRTGYVIAWVGHDDGVTAVVQTSTGRLIERSVYALEAVAPETAGVR